MGLVTRLGSNCNASGGVAAEGTSRDKNVTKKSKTGRPSQKITAQALELSFALFVFFP